MVRHSARLKLKEEVKKKQEGEVQSPEKKSSKTPRKTPRKAPKKTIETPKPPKTPTSKLSNDSTVNNASTPPVKSKRKSIVASSITPARKAVVSSTSTKKNTAKKKSQDDTDTNKTISNESKDEVDGVDKQNSDNVITIDVSANVEAVTEEQHQDSDSDQDMSELTDLALASFENSFKTSLSTLDLNSSGKHSSDSLKQKKKLVSNSLDSGVNIKSADLYLDISGKKCSNGAKLKKVSLENNAKKSDSGIVQAQKEQPQSVHGRFADKKWFNMQSMEMTSDIKRDISLIKMRNYLDPKRFYKSADYKKKVMPKVFQVGTVIEGAHEFKSSRVVKKDRQQSFMNEIMHDQKIRGYTKRKYQEIQSTKARPPKNNKSRKHF